MIVFEFKDGVGLLQEKALSNLYLSLDEMIDNGVVLVPTYLNMYIVDEKEGNKLKVTK